MQSPYSAGDFVRARGHTWHVSSVTTHDACIALTLSPPHDSSGTSLTLLHPFDRIAAVAAGNVSWVARHAWTSALARSLATLRRSDGLARVAAGDLDIFPFQLEPALAVIRDRPPRILLADAVGLGKTVQACLILAELHARARIRRTLILVPTTLREQWIDELDRRSGLAATLVDNAALRRMATTLPTSANPWAVTDIAVTSIDFAKRPEVAPALSAVPWDAVVIDEAHTVTLDTDRRAVADHVARHADYVLLLTATPHGGDSQQYAALTQLGAVGPEDALAVFRRTRQDAGFAPARRVRTIRIRMSRAGADVMRVLTAYVRELWLVGHHRGDADTRLLATVLFKRASSGPASLARTISRRRDCLLNGAPYQSHQFMLPLDDDDESADAEPDGILAARGLDVASRELAWLDRVLAAAQLAARHDRKTAALRRVLTRINEPVIVFSEYRDTLVFLRRHLSHDRRCVLLHGGLPQAERHAVLTQFQSGTVDTLLSTDAAGAGLNLQSRCRCVISLDTPWNPVRLEQRIGRVDRIGQTSMVHGICLVGRNPAEEAVAQRLRRRAERAARALQADDRPGEAESDDETFLACVMKDAPRREAVALPPRKGPQCSVIVRPRLEAAALAEADYLTRVRTLAKAAHPEARRPHTSACDVWGAACRRSADLGTGIVWLVFEAVRCDGSQAIDDERLVTVRIDGAALAQAWRKSGRSASFIRTLAAQPMVADAVARALEEWSPDAGVDPATPSVRDRRRLQTLVDERRSVSRALIQPGLFALPQAAGVEDRSARSSEPELPGPSVPPPVSVRLRWVFRCGPR